MAVVKEAVHRAAFGVQRRRKKGRSDVPKPFRNCGMNGGDRIGSSGNQGFGCQFKPFVPNWHGLCCQADDAIVLPASLAPPLRSGELMPPPAPVCGRTRALRLIQPDARRANRGRQRRTSANTASAAAWRCRLSAGNTSAGSMPDGRCATSGRIHRCASCRVQRCGSASMKCAR